MAQFQPEVLLGGDESKNGMIHKAVIACAATLVIVVMAACGASPTPNTPASTAPATSAPNAQAGLDLYRAKGCASCHGQNAGGGIGPSLAGKTRDQVFAQVRNPTGLMPAYGVDAISDAQLEQIVAFIESLGPTSSSATPGASDLPGGQGMMGGSGMMDGGMH